MPHSDHISQLLYVYIRGVVNITAGDNFLGLCDKKRHLSTWVLFSVVMMFGCF